MVAVCRQARRVSWLAWSDGQQLIGIVLHSSDELGDICNDFHHDNGTLNFGVWGSLLVGH